MLFLHYLKIIYWVNSPQALVKAVLWNVTETNIAFHLIFIMMAYANIYIVRPDDYWELSKVKYAGIFLLHLICLSLPYAKSPIMVYYMAYNTCTFWKLHCDTLEKSNQLLLENISKI